MRYTPDKIYAIVRRIERVAKLQKYNIFIVTRDINTWPKYPGYKYAPNTQLSISMSGFRDKRILIIYKDFLNKITSYKELAISIGHEFSHVLWAKKDYDIQNPFFMAIFDPYFCIKYESVMDYTGYLLAKKAGYKVTENDLIKSLETLTDPDPRRQLVVEQLKAHRVLL